MLQRIVGFWIEWKHCTFSVLPQVLLLVPWLLTKIMRPHFVHLREKWIRLLRYFVYWSQCCRHGSSHWGSCTTWLELTVHLCKSVLQPVQENENLWAVLISADMSLSLAADKRAKLQFFVEDCYQSPWKKLKQLPKLLGILFQQSLEWQKLCFAV